MKIKPPNLLKQFEVDVDADIVSFWLIAIELVKTLMTEVRGRPLAACSHKSKKANTDTFQLKTHTFVNEK